MDIPLWTDLEAQVDRVIGGGVGQRVAAACGLALEEGDPRATPAGH